MKKLSTQQLSLIKGGARPGINYTDHSSYASWMLKKLIKH